MRVINEFFQEISIITLKLQIKYLSPSKNSVI